MVHSPLFITSFILQQKNSLYYYLFDLQGMALLLKICILYMSKFSLTSKCLGTNAVIVKLVNYICTVFLKIIENCILTHSCYPYMFKSILNA